MRVFKSVIRSGALAGLTLGALTLLTGCDEKEPLEGLPEVTAELVAPPGVPAPLRRAAAHVIVNLEVEEKQVAIATDVQYEQWTFNGSVPGPMLRVRQGDQVEIRLANPATSKVVHNIDLHSVNGPGGGAVATNVAPGETSGFFFEAKAPGLYVYHCAAGIVADHIANGMYGAILVEPERGLEKVDREYYIGQHEYYTGGSTGDTGVQELDPDKLLAENPEYVVFNGSSGALTGNGALEATTGETVRLYVANGGPNLVSSFHVIGEIFDKVWNLGAITDKPLEAMQNVQTVLVPPGGNAIVQFKVDVPGDYLLVDHAISRLRKGALGMLMVTGEDDPKVFRPYPGAGGGSHAPTETPSATETPPADGTEVKMRDNVFEPRTLTVAAGEMVTFFLPNEGAVPHNMRIADADGSYDPDDSDVSDPEIINAGQSGTLEWHVPSEAGTYRFRCDIHPAEMTGTITVQ